MKIEPKYNIGQEVWFLNDDHAYKGSISQIRIGVVNEVNIIYTIRVRNLAGSWSVERAEKRLFPTKEELLKNL
jgi:hypothetical protein